MYNHLQQQFCNNEVYLRATTRLHFGRPSVDIPNTADGVHVHKQSEVALPFGADVGQYCCLDDIRRPMFAQTAFRL